MIKKGEATKPAKQAVFQKGMVWPAWSAHAPSRASHASFSHFSFLGALVPIPQAMPVEWGALLTGSAQNAVVIFNEFAVVYDKVSSPQSSLA